MYHLEPRRSEAYSVPNQYAFGSELLVAPITEPRSPLSLRGRVRVWLPDGLWTDIFTDAVYQGGRTVEMHRTDASIPVLLRAGGILPLDAGQDLDATRNPTAFEVLVAPAASGELVLAEDAEDDSVGDGSGAAARTVLSWDRERGEFRIGVAEGSTGVLPARREWTVTFLAALPEGPVTVNGAPAEVSGVDGRWSVSAAGATGAELVVRVDGGPLRVGSDRREAARVILESAQIGNPEKLEAWDVVSSDRSATERLAELTAVELPEPVRAALVEQLAARTGSVR
jgi:hypothetical protein